MGEAHAEPRQSVGELFKYDSLVGKNDIRLLKLKERSGEQETIDSRIAGKIIHRSLDDAFGSFSTGTYYAISYTWGDPKPADQLWLFETEYLFIVTSAAYILRHVTSDEYIWLDSVCINQTDTEEKPFQLRFMWGIYKYAKEALAWPESIEDTDGLAMELLFDIHYAALTREITGRMPVILPTSSIKFLPELNTSLWKKSRAPIPPDFHFHPERWRALASFLDRHWWSRAWVIQELVAAREVTIMMVAKRKLRTTRYNGNSLMITQLDTS